MKRLLNGVYVFSDSYLKKKTKAELIEYIRTIEKNWINAEESNNIQYENCKRLLAEERNKAIDDFAEKLKRENKETIPTHSGYCRMSFDEVVDEIAEQLKEQNK